MSAKFTKGEWAICDGDSHSKEVTITTEERENSLTVPICEMDIRFTGDIGLEQVANAHLIAAAPEMYAMLETVQREIASLIDEVNDQRLSHVNILSERQPDLCDQETVHDIQVLLAKARGEE